MDIYLSSTRKIHIDRTETILSALKKAGVYLVASCGGKGTCGKCKVIIKKGRYETRSTIRLSDAEVSSGYVLACQSRVKEDIFIEIPKESVLTVGDKIAVGRADALFELLNSLVEEVSPLTKRYFLELPAPSLDDNISDLERVRRGLSKIGLENVQIPFRLLSELGDGLREGNWKVTVCITDSGYGREVIRIIPEYKKTPHYGLAVDIGTTTIVVYLVDLITGRLVDVASTYNSQIRYGDDVITRIVHATEHNGLHDLKDAIVSDINSLLVPITERHGITWECINSMVFAGNTTMTHLFFGLNPQYIREEPYIPTANVFPFSWAAHNGIKINPHAPIYAVPCVASYVGGDIVAGVLASRLHKQAALSLFMDIGTNGEIVFGNSEWMVTAACSAGPCFEGSGIRHGMRATEGAIEDITIDPLTYEPALRVIGGVEPIGICGSGMIDAISEMFLNGIIDQKGKFIEGIKTDRVRNGSDGREFVLYKDIALTEVDIENIIRAKAAIYAGLSILLKEVGFGFDDVKKLYIAGGFGNYLDVKKAIILGMLPDMPIDRFEFLGNTSVTGAYLCLLSDRLRKEAEDIARKMTYIELSVNRGFMDEYMSALFLPHTDIKAFPTVAQRLKGS